MSAGSSQDLLNLLQDSTSHNDLSTRPWSNSSYIMGPEDCTMKIFQDRQRRACQIIHKICFSRISENQLKAAPRHNESNPTRTKCREGCASNESDLRRLKSREGCASQTGARILREPAQSRGAWTSGTFVREFAMKTTRPRRSMMEPLAPTVRTLQCGHAVWKKLPNL